MRRDLNQQGNGLGGQAPSLSVLSLDVGNSSCFQMGLSVGVGGSWHLLSYGKAVDRRMCAARPTQSDVRGGACPEAADENSLAYMGHIWNVPMLKMPWLEALPSHVPVPGLVAEGQMQDGAGGSTCHPAPGTV